ncbi:MAG: dihydropteroate synthase [Alphaproteobacteria bacterium]
MRLEERFTWGARTHVMGILNVTPDSFSGDGVASTAAAVAQARAFAASGADIVDIGGESTRPGAEAIGAAAEAARVLPVIAAVRDALPDMVVSIDTYRAKVAEAALDAGADIINDVWSLRADPDMATLAAARGATVILMHNRSRPGHAEIDARLGGRYIPPDYGDLLGEVGGELAALAQQARDAGIEPDRIILDPGLGFGKTVNQNLALINHLDQFRALGYPLLLGASRKSFIGKVLDAPVNARQFGTAATVALAIIRGADIVRVHDVAEMAQVARMTDAMLRAPLT